MRSVGRMMMMMVLSIGDADVDDDDGTTFDIPEWRFATARFVHFLPLARISKLAAPFIILLIASKLQLSIDPPTASFGEKRMKINR